MPYKNIETRRKRAKEIYNLNPQKQIFKTHKRRVEIKQWFRDYKKTLACSLCKENHPAVLDFHHNGEKINSVTTMVVNGRGKKAIINEITKCVVLCANCHRKLHYNNYHTPVA